MTGLITHFRFLVLGIYADAKKTRKNKKPFCEWFDGQPWQEG